jgi:hypothetical protein
LRCNPGERGSGGFTRWQHARRVEAKAAIPGYQRIVGGLAAIIIPLSMISFICTAISGSITADLKIANDLAVRLHTQLDASPTDDADQIAPLGSLADLQQFVATISVINGRSRQLNYFVLNISYDPLEKNEPGEKEDETHRYSAMQLSPTLHNTVAGPRPEVNSKTAMYQIMRLYANSTQDLTAIFWGAVSTCILPALFALLDSSAYVVRPFTVQNKNRTFTGSCSTTGRFIVAGIGGGVVGLFGNSTITRGVTLPPLAYTFLIGYAADIFFSLLDGSMQRLPIGKSR